MNFNSNVAFINNEAMKKDALKLGKTLAMLGFLLLAAEPALAADLPWVKPLCEVAQSLSGPVANSVGVICVVLTGLAFAFGEVSGMLKTILGVLFGLSMAFLANSWLSLLDRTAACFATS